jgi:heme oxygenase
MRRWRSSATFMTPSPAERLRADTRGLHAAVERAGIMPKLLRGELDRCGYCRLLRNLHDIYRSLEPALLRHAAQPAVAPVVLPELFRADPLDDDMVTLHGSAWPGLPSMPATRIYVDRLRQIARDDPPLLVAHAYVRYLGDLSGGRIVRKIVAESLCLDGGNGLRFYDFGGDERAASLAERLRRGIDDACARAPLDAIVAEAQQAFRLHARLFEELAD